MSPVVALGIALFSTASTGYDELKSEAEPVTNLGRFLEHYVGDCHPKDAPEDFNKADCLAKVRAYQKSYRGKRLLIEVGELGSQLHFAGWDKRKKAYRVHLTPMFSERSYGLSVGRPKKLNKAGLPVVRNLPIWVPRPDGEPEFIFKKKLNNGMVRLELIVTPKRTWRFSRKKEDDLAGVEVKLLGLRLFESRGSKLLAEQSY